MTVIRALAAPGSPSINSVISRETKRDLFAGKLTWSPSPNHTLTASAFGDPGTITGPVFMIAGPEVTWNGTRDIGSTDIVGRYDGTFGNSFLIRAMYGVHREKDTYGGAGRNTAQLIDQTVSPNTTQNGFTFFQDQEFSRDVLKLDMTKFLGRHEIKIGGDYELVNSLSENYQGGAGQRIYQLRQASTGIVYYRHRYYVDDLAPGFNRDDPSTWQIALPQVAEPRTKGYSAYFQDSWKVTPYFTLNLGLRWEMQDVQDRFNETAFKLDDNWAPRLGFIWDISKSGKSKLYANYGPLLREHPAGHQHPRLRRRGRLLLLQLQREPGRHRQRPPERRRARSCSAAQRRWTRSSRASTSTSTWAASSTRWRRTSCSAPRSPTATWAA